MKADYKNWMPRWIILTISALCVAMLVVAIVLGFHGSTLRTVMSWICAVGFVVLGVVSFNFIRMYRAFDYNGKRRLSWDIIKGVASYVIIPAGGKGLDVGCGSGALAIACAKRNPGADVVGIDRWGVEYAAYNKAVCENNAKAEGVNNVQFQQGNALHLDFADASFDAVMSNYVYHNIPSGNRQEILRETLRVLKKGGVFAIHDIFTKKNYGDMEAFVAQLKKEGYEKIELLDTSTLFFHSVKEAKSLQLYGSVLLFGIK